MDPGTRFLIDLILADERRHHDLFTSLTEAALGVGGAPVPAPSRAEAEAILEATEQFVAAEKDDRKELDALRKRLRGGDVGMWHMLIEVMSFDTSKHITILEFLQKRLRAELEKPMIARAGGPLTPRRAAPGVVDGDAGRAG